MPRLLLPESLEKKSEALRSFLGETFAGGVEIVCYRNPDQAMNLLSGETVDLLIIPLEPGGTEHRGLIAVAGQSEPAIPVVGLMTGQMDAEPEPPPDINGMLASARCSVDFAEVRGQEAVKRAIVIAAAIKKTRN